MLTLDEFNNDKREALLSLDEQKIRAFCRKWQGKEMPNDMKLFWGGVHKAITGTQSLPLEFRQQSKDYLDAYGLHSFDDGELK